MTQMIGVDRDAWLPNLTAGVSIWNLAADLNRPALFDGRLLVPRVEGALNLPTRVEWNVTGLMPLAEARAAHPVEVERAIAELARCVERALAVFEQPGFAPHRAAFTLPSLELEAHYFFSPDDGKLYVASWGASPRKKIAQRTEHVVDALRFGELARRSQRAPALEAAAPVLAGRTIASPVASSTRRYAWLALIGALSLIALGALFAWPDDQPVPRPPPPEPPQHDAPPLAHDAAVPRVQAPPPLPAPHQKIYFARGDRRFGDDQRESLDAIAAYLREHREVRALLIEGHADFRGSEPDNRGLSGERALRVRAELVASGIDESRLTAAACSELHPLVASPSDEGQRANRRVEFFVIDPPLAPSPHEGCLRVGR